MGKGPEGVCRLWWGSARQRAVKASENSRCSGDSGEAHTGAGRQAEWNGLKSECRQRTHRSELPRRGPHLGSLCTHTRVASRSAQVRTTSRHSSEAAGRDREAGAI